MPMGNQCRESALIISLGFIRLEPPYTGRYYVTLKYLVNLVKATYPSLVVIVLTPMRNIE